MHQESKHIGFEKRDHIGSVSPRQAFLNTFLPRRHKDAKVHTQRSATNQEKYF